MKMRTFFQISIVLGLLACIATHAAEDRVRLTWKDGRTVEGRRVSETDDAIDVEVVEGALTMTMTYRLEAGLSIQPLPDDSLADEKRATLFTEQARLLVASTDNAPPLADLLNQLAELKKYDGTRGAQLAISRVILAHYPDNRNAKHELEPDGIPAAVMNRMVAESDAGANAFMQNADNGIFGGMYDIYGIDSSYYYDRNSILSRWYFSGTLGGLSSYYYSDYPIYYSNYPIYPNDSTRYLAMPTSDYPTDYATRYANRLAASQYGVVPVIPLEGPDGGAGTVSVSDRYVYRIVARPYYITPNDYNSTSPVELYRGIGDGAYFDATFSPSGSSLDYVWRAGYNGPIGGDCLSVMEFGRNAVGFDAFGAYGVSTTGYAIGYSTVGRKSAFSMLYYQYSGNVQR